MAAYSAVRYIGNGATRLYVVPFPYIDKANVMVKIDGNLSTAYTWTTTSSIEFTTAPGDQLTIDIIRSTPLTEIDGIDNGFNLTEDTLQTAFDRVLYGIQEEHDWLAAATSIGGDVTVSINLDPVLLAIQNKPITPATDLQPVLEAIAALAVTDGEIQESIAALPDIIEEILIDMPISGGVWT